MNEVGEAKARRREYINETTKGENAKARTRRREYEDESAKARVRRRDYEGDMTHTKLRDAIGIVEKRKSSRRMKRW